jgi:hypothetical protein
LLVQIINMGFPVVGKYKNYSELAGNKDVQM